jgi:hypothetical protein
MRSAKDNPVSFTFQKTMTARLYFIPKRYSLHCEAGHTSVETFTWAASIHRREVGRRFGGCLVGSLACKEVYSGKWAGIKNDVHETIADVSTDDFVCGW